jgi:hypothetical protein
MKVNEGYLRFCRNPVTTRMQDDTHNLVWGASRDLTVANASCLAGRGSSPHTHIVYHRAACVQGQQIVVVRSKGSSTSKTIRYMFYIISKYCNVISVKRYFTEVWTNLSFLSSNNMSPSFSSVHSYDFASKLTWFAKLAYMFRWNIKDSNMCLSRANLQYK